MKTYPIILALLAGVAFTALLALLLNLPSLLFVIPASFLLAPGGIVGALFSKAHALGSPVPMLAANSVIYAALGYVALRRWLHFETARLKLMAASAVVPVFILGYFACLPSASPLWPRGMSQLAEEEKSLRDGLPAGSSLDFARAFLKSRNIDAYEQESQSKEVVFQNANLRIVAQPGERVLSARVPTEAGQFPCGFRIDIVLVFDKSHSLKQNHIERFPICP